MFDIVLKFHDQTPSVVKVITIPVIIQKRSVRYLFIGRSNNREIIYVYYCQCFWFGVGLHSCLCWWAQPWGAAGEQCLPDPWKPDILRTGRK